jgi:hypothetical protein
MEPMEELNDKLNNEFFEAVKGKGEPITFSQEELAECKERYIKLSEEGSKIEARVRKERALAATKPDVYLTF